MEETTTIGIDLAKRVFELAALSSGGEIIWRKRLGRAAFMRFMEVKAPRCLVGLEAGGGAHYWGRWLTARGFEVKLMSPRAVKAYLGGGHKNDARDAAAVAEAAGRAHVSSVAIKSEAAQSLQALVRVRARQIGQLTQSTHQLRGLLMEFGFIAPRGRGRLLEAFETLRQSPGFAALPVMAQEMFAALRQDIAGQAERLKLASAQLAAAVGADPRCRLLTTIPGIGPVNAATLASTIEAPHAFRNGRAFAAYLGLVPRQVASGGRSRMLGITKHGQSQARSLLVLAAHSVLAAARRAPKGSPPKDRLRGWALALAARKPHNLATVALAARLARIAWAVMAKHEPYRGRPIAD